MNLFFLFVLSLEIGKGPFILGSFGYFYISTSYLKFNVLFWIILFSTFEFYLIFHASCYCPFLHVDYNLLEEVKRVAEVASRTRTKLGMSTYLKLPHPLKSLQYAARSRSTKLLVLPNGMSKRENNQSRFDDRYYHLS